jgi:hypothetical protein
MPPERLPRQAHFTIAYENVTRAIEGKCWKKFALFLPISCYEEATLIYINYVVDKCWQVNQETMETQDNVLYLV